MATISGTDGRFREVVLNGPQGQLVLVGRNTRSDFRQCESLHRADCTIGNRRSWCGPAGRMVARGPSD